MRTRTADWIHVAIMLLSLGLGMLVAASKNHGWPLFLVVPAYGAAGFMILAALDRTFLTGPRPMLYAVFLAVLSVVLYSIG